MVDQRPSILRVIFALLILLLSASAAVTFVNYASSPTDENIFADTKVKMNLYVTKDIAATPVRASWGEKYIQREDQPPPFILVGDLINLVHKKPVTTLDELTHALDGISPDSGVVVYIYRPAAGVFIAYRLERPILPESCVTVIKNFIEVTAVTPGGASDRAGMLVGDLIFRINGQGFNNVQEADFILRRGQTGKTILYEILRKNEHVTLHVTLARFGFPLGLLMFSLSGIFMMGVGTFITLKRPQIRAARTVGWGLLLLGYFVTIAVIRRDADMTWFIVARNASVQVALVVGLILIAWSTAMFPKERPDLLKKRWILWLNIGLGVATIALSFIGKEPLTLGMLGLIIASNIVIKVVYRKGATPEHRRLSRVIQWTSLGVAGASVGAVFLAALFVRGGLLGLLGIVLLAIPLSFLYTIGRYRLLDMNLRIKRNVQYSLVSIFWGLLLAYVLLALFMALPGFDLHLPVIVVRGASIEVLDDAQAGVSHEWTNRIVLMLLGVGVWYVLWRLRKVGQNWIDHKYYRTQYDYRRAVRELGEVLATKLSMADLGKGLAGKLAELMQVRRAGVFFFRDGSAAGCNEAFGIEGGEWTEFCSPVESRLSAALASVRESILADYLPAPLPELFRAHGFHLLVPVRSNDRLLGAMVLGEKLSEATYSHDDYAFLTAAAQQGAVSMENAFLYEELAEKERMRHELQIARRIQLASLPQRTPVLKGLDLAGVSVPALEVGGDFFDYLNGALDTMTVVVGDVSGKGTSAALYMSKIQGILRSLHAFGLTPGDLFIHANRLLCSDMEKNSFVTAVGAAFDAKERTVLLARAGHLPLYMYRMGKGRVEKITPRGLGLGLNNAGVFSSELEQKLLSYTTGDVLLFVTDGVTEAQNDAAEQFGEDRLMALLAAHAGSDAASIRDALLQDVNSFIGGAVQHDDETIVVVKGT